MKRETTMLTTFALVLALALPCWAQVRELPTQTTTIAGTIETIDQSKRAMNIKTADGKFVAVSVPDSVKRFSELKVGQAEGDVQQQRVGAPEAGGRGGRRCR